LADWLFEKDEYIPKEDKVKFIDKSIIGFLNILSLIKRKASLSNGYVYSLNPVIKLGFTILIIIFLSLSRSFLFVWTVNVYLFLLLSSLNGEEIKDILKVSLIVPIFTIIILIPSILMGNKLNSLLMLSKIIGTIIAINMISYTTRWTHLTKALKLMCIPDVFILVFDITLKYIYILGEFSLEMLYALKLRSVGSNNNKYGSITGVIGGLFLKSKDMAEEMYSAMECRGFSGEYSSNIKFKFTFKDFMYCLLNTFIIGLYFYIGRM